MKRYYWLAAAICVVFALGVARTALAEDQAKTVTGKISCGGCSGVVDKCSVMLTDKDGMRWILTGDSESVKSAFNARHDGKTFKATLSGAVATKKDKAGKEYKEAKAKDVTVSEG